MPIGICQLKHDYCPEVNCKFRYASAYIKVYTAAEFKKERGLVSAITVGVSYVDQNLINDPYKKFLLGGVHIGVITGGYFQAIQLGHPLY